MVIDNLLVFSIAVKNADVAMIDVLLKIEAIRDGVDDELLQDAIKDALGKENLLMVETLLKYVGSVDSSLLGRLLNFPSLLPTMLSVIEWDDLIRTAVWNDQMTIVLTLLEMPKVLDVMLEYNFFHTPAHLEKPDNKTRKLMQSLFDIKRWVNYVESELDMTRVNTALKGIAQVIDNVDGELLPYIDRYITESVRIINATGCIINNSESDAFNLLKTPFAIDTWQARADNMLMHLMGTSARFAEMNDRRLLMARYLLVLQLAADKSDVLPGYAVCGLLNLRYGLHEPVTPNSVSGNEYYCIAPFSEEESEIAADARSLLGPVFA